MLSYPKNSLTQEEFSAYYRSAWEDACEDATALSEIEFSGGIPYLRFDQKSAEFWEWAALAGS